MTTLPTRIAADMEAQHEHDRAVLARRIAETEHELHELRQRLDELTVRQTPHLPYGTAASPDQARRLDRSPEFVQCVLDEAPSREAQISHFHRSLDAVKQRQQRDAAHQRRLDEDATATLPPFADVA